MQQHPRSPDPELCSYLEKLQGQRKAGVLCSQKKVPWAVRTVADCNSHITQIAQRFRIKSGVWGLEHPRHNQLRHNQRHKLSCQMIYSLGFLAGIQSNGGGPVGDCKIWMPKTFKNLSMQHRRDARSLQTSLHKGRNKRCLVVTYTLRHSPISWSCPTTTSTTLGRQNKCLVSSTNWTISRNSTSYTAIQMLDTCGRYTDPYNIPWCSMIGIQTADDIRFLKDSLFIREKEKDIEWLDQLGDCTPKCDEEQIPAHADFLHS